MNLFAGSKIVPLQKGVNKDRFECAVFRKSDILVSDTDANIVEDDIEMEDKEETPEAENTQGSSSDGHRFEEQVNLHLESADPSKLRNINRKFVRVSSMATITHLKKFLAIQLLDKDDPEAYRDIDVTCDGELIPKVRRLLYNV